MGEEEAMWRARCCLVAYLHHDEHHRENVGRDAATNQRRDHRVEPESEHGDVSDHDKRSDILGDLEDIVAPDVEAQLADVLVRLVRESHLNVL